MKELKCPHCGNVFKVDKEAFDTIAAQVRDAAFEEELSRRADEIKSRLKAEAEAARLGAEQKLRITIAGKDAEIARLSAVEQAAADRMKAAVLEERAKGADKMRDAEIEMAKLRNEAEAQRRKTEAEIADLKARHALVISEKDREIEYHKDFKARLSTKMLGETLEIHCSILFAQAQSMGMFPNAYFAKDNDASGGSKGDFIFRDFIDGREYISIMFEMKNEADATASKHRNADFFDKLDRDRREKGCEYAVLVSMLERDSELYNNGIVSVSHRYPKMYVVRPHLFMTLITLLTQAAKKSWAEISELHKELEIARAQSIDVTNFETRRDNFVADFSRLIEQHVAKHDDAIENIDKVIAALEKQIEQLRKVKSLFDASEQKLVRAGDKVENDFTIKKLTRGNPTMKKLFEEDRRRREMERGGELDS